MKFQTILVAAVLVFCGAASFAGGSGAILGRILENTNQSAVANAVITVRNESSGFEAATTAAEDGTFFIASLPPGDYTIRVNHEGFQQNTISGYPVRIPERAAPASAQIRLARNGASRAPAVFGAAPARPQKDSAANESLLELRIHWTANSGVRSQNNQASSLAMSAEGFSLVDSHRTNGPMPRQRMPQLSSDQILVVITDQQGEQTGWTLIPDARILRAESPGPDGQLTGQVLHRSQAEFLISIPADSAAGLSFYEPRWNGKQFSLALLGAAGIR